MAYKKQIFENGDILDAEHLNNIRLGILSNETTLNNINKDIDDLTAGLNKIVPAVATVGQFLKVSGVDKDGKVTAVVTEEVSVDVPNELPTYTEADYGKMLTPTADGLVWADPPAGGETLEDLEGVLF